MNFVFLSKNGRFVTHICFSKKRAWNPNFIVFFGCALFGPRCQKREIWKATKKNGKIWLITEKLFFGIFAVFWGGAFFSCFFWFFLFALFFWCFFWRVYGSGEVARRATSLSPKPSLFLFFFVFFVLFFEFFFEGLWVRWGGPKGHLTWP